jgi:hypothetical protein
VEGFIELTTRVARVQGQTSPLIGVIALLGLAGDWRAGGAGLLLLERISLDVPAPLPETNLHFGYGGLVVDRVMRLGGGPARSGGRTQMLARLLVGGGNAEEKDAATGTRLRSDNFLLLEPAVQLEAALVDWASAGVAVAYRFAIGVDGLQNIEEENLRGGSFGVSIRFGPF